MTAPHSSPASLDEAARVEAVIAAMRGGGHRITRDRRVIVQALVASSGHLSVDDVVDRIALDHPEVHAATVYRTVDALEQLGLLYHVHLGHGAARWHLADDPHHHLYCQGCGAVIEVDDETVVPLAALVEERHGFVIDQRHFALVGRCSKCVASDS
ncbi:MAG: Fur family transcriptional regulator [Acidimicrobiales bacterium]